jgi:diadenosine tetraphosphate (Ap4A) HIT family hydrolase
LEKIEMSATCPFCMLNDKKRIVLEDEIVLALRDQFPISPGHTLIIPKRHVSSFFETSELEQMALLRALHLTQAELKHNYHADGFNIGINDGVVAGQTVMHLHIHLIPRYRGDCADPRGGIRWLFPDKAVYWKK